MQDRLKANLSEILGQGTSVASVSPWEVQDWASFTESCICLKQVQERFLADGNDRLKLVVLLCGEDDHKLQNAAAGALAMLTAAHKKLCLKMTEVVRAGQGQVGAG